MIESRSSNPRFGDIRTPLRKLENPPHRAKGPAIHERRKSRSYGESGRKFTPEQLGKGLETGNKVRPDWSGTFARVRQEERKSHVCQHGKCAQTDRWSRTDDCKETMQW